MFLASAPAPPSRPLRPDPLLLIGSRLAEVRMVEESQAMKDACKIILEPLTENGRVRVGFGTSLLEEARTAGRGEGIL